MIKTLLRAASAAVLAVLPLTMTTLAQAHAATLPLADAVRAAQGLGEQGPAPVQRGSVALMTQEFRAAVAQTSA